MGRSIIEKLKDGKVLCSDGAWGTNLMKAGLKPGTCPESWNLTNENEVFSLAKSYIDAGSDMIKTNSFGGNRLKLSAYGLEDKVFTLNEAAAKISRKAADNNFVIGSIGPTGKMLIMEETTEEELYDVFAEQAKALEAGGADAACIETMMDTEEAVIAIKAVKENTDLEIICTFTCSKTAKGEFRTLMGQEISDACVEAKNAGADIVGANCGDGIADMIPIVKKIKQALPDTPVIIHANAGIPQLIDGINVFPSTPEQMANEINDIIAAGASIIGGCCGTTPEHICEIKKAILK